MKTVKVTVKRRQLEHVLLCGLEGYIELRTMLADDPLKRSIYSCIPGEITLELPVEQIEGQSFGFSKSKRKRYRVHHEDYGGTVHGGDIIELEGVE